MTDRPAKALFPNPFYVLLLLASVLFVATTFGYLVSPSFRPPDGPNGATPSPAAWLDRNGPLALGCEVAAMILSGLLAMATDRWFPAGPVRNDRSPRS